MFDSYSFKIIWNEKYENEQVQYVACCQLIMLALQAAVNEIM